MKANKLRIGSAALSVVALAGLAACSSSNTNHASGGSGSGATLQGLSGAGMYGSLPAAATGTEKTGTIKIALLGGSPPTYIFPVTPAASASIYDDNDFMQLSWRPLYWTVNGDSPSLNVGDSLANAPVWTNNDQTLTVSLKDWKWSDGQPVTSADVAFFFYLTKAALKESPANWAYYTPGLGLPDEVSSLETPNASTVVFNLTKSVNPSWFVEDELSELYAIPSHAWDIDATGGAAITDWATNPADAKKIYDYLNAQSKSLGTYATNPLWQVVDGPYKVTAFNGTTGDYSMAPNTTYGGEHAKTISPIQVTAYTTDAAEFTALKAGAADLAYVPSDDVPEASSVAGSYNLWGYPGAGWQGAFYNFKDKTGDFGNVISQLYVRQALQHLVDQQGIVKAYLHGAGSPGYGVVSQYPSSPFTPSNVLSDPFPYSPSTASSILKAHGWSVVPDGTDTCTSPGTGPSDCGAGIPAGTKLAWSLDYASSVALGQEMVTNLASVARSIGIEITLKAESFNTITANDNDVSTPADVNQWAMSDFGGFTNSTYPTTFGLFNSTGSFDMGGFSNNTLDNLITASISSANPTAVENELSYITTQLPVMFQPNPDWDGADAGIMAISKTMSGPPASFADYSQYFLTPEFWYFKS
jgi:peptide/nickel transport system substrate-binding protein